MGRYVGIGLVCLLLVGGVGACTVGGSVLGSYNTRVQKDEGVDSQWGQVQNVYQRRNDLVPTLVETVRGLRDPRARDVRRRERARDQGRRSHQRQQSQPRHAGTIPAVARGVVERVVADGRRRK